MEDVGTLNDAFVDFMAASRSLESIYAKLEERVQYLAYELEKKNKELENALYESQEVKDYLKEILESLREAIIVLDTSGRITMFNRAAERLLGLNIVEALGKPFRSLDVAIEHRGMDTVLCANGRRYQVFTSLSNVLDAGGAIRGQVLLLQDITRIKELEACQERNKRLIAMGEMAATIVHEVRSPLCSIELYATMLEKEVENTSASELARGISTGIRSLNNILSNMHFFAKPQKPALKELELEAVINETVMMLMPMIDSRSIELKRLKSDDLIILGDCALLKQVFMNVLINAIQVSPEAGTIEIAQRRLEGYAVVQISDEGEGIEQENIERIFDPFFSTKENGTGLGLAITTKIVQAHDGAINVASELGNGSTFSLYFPLVMDSDDIKVQLKEAGRR